MTPIPFSSFGGYRPFCSHWWKDLWRTLTTGWIYDLRAYWHRARYGWAPCDTWSLDLYLDRVLAGALVHLAVHTHGSPYGYGHPHADIAALDPNDDASTNHALWQADLLRWAHAFDLASDESDLYQEPQRSHLTQKERWTERTRREQACRDALAEMLPYWDALWD